jgi:hypothetical protein
MVAALLVISPATPGSAGVRFHIADPRIVEASGIAAGITSPAVDYVENDSGDTNPVLRAECAHRRHRRDDHRGRSAQRRLGGHRHRAGRRRHAIRVAG